MPATPDVKQLSIVVPIYNEVESIEALVSELHAALDHTGLDYEILCIDDGSPDGSFELLARLAANDPRLVVGSFRRNFGQTAAMQAGISAARGAVVVTL